LESLKTIFKGHRKATGKCPNTRGQQNRRGGRITQRLLAKELQFPSFFSEVLRFIQHFLKVDELWKILQTPSGSSIFALSIHTTFSQTQLV
jgi:hypothetical protein